MLHPIRGLHHVTERGAPGTIWTTFPYRDKGVRTGVKGAGQVVSRRAAQTPRQDGR